MLVSFHKREPHMRIVCKCDIGHTSKWPPVNCTMTAHIKACPNVGTPIQIFSLMDHCATTYKQIFNALFSIFGELYTLQSATASQFTSIVRYRQAERRVEIEGPFYYCSTNTARILLEKLNSYFHSG